MPRIAWMNDSKDNFCLDETLEEFGYSIEIFRTVTQALRAFDTTRYDTIILNTRVPPGMIGFDHEEGTYDNDPRINEIMREHEEKFRGTTNPDHWKLTMYAIEVAQRSNSPNRNTPIFMVGVHNEEGDLLFPDVTEVCRKAGTIDYYNFSNEQRYQALIRDIRRLTM